MRFGGTSIVVTPSWFLSAVVIVVLTFRIIPRLVPLSNPAWAAAVAVALAVLLGISVLVHEIGHCVVARRFGIQVPEIRLYLIGGLSELERPPATPREEAWIAAAGPLSSALLGVACWGVATAAQPNTLLWLFAWEMALANGVIAVFNVLPALPLDGGRILRAGVWRLFRRSRPGTLAGVVGGLLLAAALLVWTVLVLLDGRFTLLQAAIMASVALFVATGAWAELPEAEPGSEPESEPESGPELELKSETPSESPPWPPDFPLSALLHPVPPQIAQPHPGMIVLPGDDPAAAVARMLSLSLPYLVLMDESGLTRGVVMRSDIDRVLADRA